LHRFLSRNTKMALSTRSSNTFLQSWLRGVSTRLAYLKATLSMINRAARGWTLIWATLLCLQGLLPAASVYLTKIVIDSLVAAMRLGNTAASIQLVWVPAVWLGMVLFVTEVSRIGLNLVRKIQAELVRDWITNLVQQQSTTLDLEFHESSEYHDRLYQARSEASQRPLALLESIGSLAQNSLTLLAMATVLVQYGVWLPLVLVASAVPAVLIVMRFNRRYYRWWEKSTADRRRADYYDFLMTQSIPAAEIRLFDLGNHLQSGYQQIRYRLRREEIALAKEQSLSQLGGGLSGLVIASGAIAWMGWQTLQGQLTLGDLALFYQAFNRGQGLMRTLLSNLTQIYDNSLFLGNLFEFLQLKSSVIDSNTPKQIGALREGVEFRNVTFSYPGSDRIILKDFNLTIPAGKIVAIVGENGAGKSTLIKLLCRFYDPQSGSVEFDRINLKDLPLKEVRRLLTVMFQFPVTYQRTVAENIAIGDVRQTPTVQQIEDAIQDAGAEEVVARLPKKAQTQLGKWFADGTDLSGGEWQRISLARAFFRKAPIVVLDEPTSFMDTWSEHDWLDRFRKMTSGRTALVITHRFTLAMRADIIHVMQAGQVVESGSHQELLALNGLYAESWRSQMQEASQSH
jgi:ATP-binding cassette, subfamily B, bacterial